MRQRADILTILNRGKIVPVLLAAVVLLNGLVPRYAAGLEDASLFHRIMDSQAAVLVQFFALTTLPVRIVTDLYQGKQALPESEEEQQGRLPADTANTANTSSEFMLTAPQINVTVSRGCSDDSSRLSRQSPDMHYGTASAVLRALPVSLRVFAEGTVCPLFIRMMFILLPRSSLDEHDIRPSKGVTPMPHAKTCPASQDRFFLLY